MPNQVSYDSRRRAARTDVTATARKRANPAADISTNGYVPSRLVASSRTFRPSPNDQPTVVRTACPAISQTVAKPSHRWAHARRSIPNTWSSQGLRAMRTSWMSARYVPRSAVIWPAAAILTAAGQITALLGTYLALVQLVLMARSPWLAQVFGMDRLAWAHRWLGFATVWLIAGHAVLTTVGWSLGDGRSVLDEATNLLGTYPFVLMSAAGLACFLAVAVTSVRAARRHQHERVRPEEVG